MNVVTLKGKKMMENPIMGAVESGPLQKRSTHISQWIGVYIATALSVLVGLASWTASQFVSIRDSVQSLQDRVPVQLESINTRLSSVEHRMDTQDERLYSMERK